MAIRKAVLPVAGFGTRVLPATKSVPKEMLPVVDRPALQYVVDEALQAGIEHIVFITGRNKGAIEDYFDRAYELEATLDEKRKVEASAKLKPTTLKPGCASFVRQQTPLGLGHAIWCARDIIGDEPFAVLLPDVIVQAEMSCLAQMTKLHDHLGGNMIAVDAVPAKEVFKYGVIAPGQRDGRLIEMTGMVEKPSVDQAPSNLKITGRYILQPEIFALLADQGAGAGGEIQLTDAMHRLMQTQKFHAYEYEGRDYDCGSILGYFEAVLGHALQHNEIAEDALKLISEAVSKSR
jgi:UTP--glucose-1-phosphate uridylyltransferase